jgi:hypothetical protein
MGKVIISMELACNDTPQACGWSKNGSTGAVPEDNAYSAGFGREI